MKVTVVGGGSTYTPELVVGFLDRKDTFPITELCLLDIDPKRLEVVGGFARRLVRARGAPFQVTLSTTPGVSSSTYRQPVPAIPPAAIAGSCSLQRVTLGPLDPRGPRELKVQ